MEITAETAKMYSCVGVGRPQDGIWLVSNNGTSCQWIGKQGMSQARIDVESYRAQLEELLLNVLKTPVSIHAMAGMILDLLTEVVKRS